MPGGGEGVLAVDAAVAVAGAGAAPGYSSEITFTVVMSCLMAASGGLIFGYDISITDEVVPGGLLPGDHREDEQRGAGRLLHLRQPGAHHLRLLALPRRRVRMPGRRPRHEEGRQEELHAHRRLVLPGRRHPQLRRRQHLHARHRPHLPRLRRWLHKPVCTCVLGGDRAGAVARGVHKHLPLLPQRGDVRGRPGQLPRQHHPGVGLAPLPRRRHHPGRRHPRWRALHPGLAQQPGAAREGRGGSQLFAPDPRADRRRRRRAQRHHARRGGGRTTQVRRVPAHPAARVPAPPCHGDRHSLVLRANWHDRGHALRAAPLLHHRVHEPEGHPRLHHHRRRQSRVHLRGRALRRPLRPSLPLQAGRRRPARVPGRDDVDLRRRAGHQRREGHAEALRGGRGGAGVPLRGRVRRLLGPAQVDHPQRDLPAGGEVGGAEHERVHLPHAHLRADAVLPRHALQLQVWLLRLQCRLGRRHDGVHHRLPSGDQGRAHRGHGRGLGTPLVLEALRQADIGAGADTRTRQTGRRVA